MKGQLPRFLPYVHDLLPTVEWVMHWMCQIQGHFHSKDAWHTYWMNVSRDGYDVDKHNSCCVHVKLEYFCLLSLFCVLSPYCKECMTFLAQSIPCLHPEVCPETEHDMIMKADVIEILIAALRGHPDVAPMLVHSGIGLIDFHGLPHALGLLMEVCRTVQLLDAFLVTGWLKDQELHVQRLTSQPAFRGHPFVHQWQNFNSKHCHQLSTCLPFPCDFLTIYLVPVCDMIAVRFASCPLKYLLEQQAKPDHSLYQTYTHRCK